QDDLFSAQCMPPNALNRSGKKLRHPAVVPQFGLRQDAGWHPTQIHFVPLRRGCEIRGAKTDHLRGPTKVVGGGDFAVTEQLREKAPLQRGMRKQRAVDIEECDAHAASADLRVRTATASWAKKRQPSTSTGNPRNKQNTAVAQVRICAT